MTATDMPAPAYERAAPTYCRVVHTALTVRVYLPRDKAGTTMGWVRIDAALPLAKLDAGEDASRIVSLRPHRKGETVVTSPLKRGQGEAVAAAVARAVRPAVASVSAAAARAPRRPAPSAIDLPGLFGWLDAHGAEADKVWGYSRVLHTKLGPLSVTPYADWIACRFHDVERAAKHFGVTRLGCDRLNPHSGKWNWHPSKPTYGSIDYLVHAFKAHVEALLPAARREVSP